MCQAQVDSQLARRLPPVGESVQGSLNVIPPALVGLPNGLDGPCLQPRKAHVTMAGPPRLLLSNQHSTWFEGLLGRYDAPKRVSNAPAKLVLIQTLSEEAIPLWVAGPSQPAGLGLGLGLGLAPYVCCSGPGPL